MLGMIKNVQSQNSPAKFDWETLTYLEALDTECPKGYALSPV